MKLQKILFIIVMMSIHHHAIAEGPIRSFIKERIKKKMEEKPAPEVDNSKQKNLSPGTYTFSIESDNKLLRYYKIHIPKSYDGSKDYPLVLALHGGGGDMDVQADDDNYHHITSSENNNYVVVFPNGYSSFQSGKFATWNAGACCGPARNNKIDDVTFIKNIITDVKSKVRINSQMIFSEGMSNGAMMSYRLACELSDTIKAIGAVAGTDNTLDCPNKKAISLIHIHSKKDDHVLYDGGLGPKALSKEAETDFKSVPATIEKWKTHNECSGSSQTIWKTDGAHCEIYDKCKNGTKIKLCVTEDGGHSWPGGKKARRTGANVSKKIDATQEIWDFFKSLP